MNSSRRVRGRPVLGAFAGFFLGLFLAIDLLLLSRIALDSAWVTSLPMLGTVLGLVLGFTAPLRRRRPGQAGEASASVAVGEGA